MLRRVTIENFKLIRDVEIEFGEGLNVISGETGTGKSMTISALEFVMGKQGDYPEGSAVEVELEFVSSAVILRREVRNRRSRYFLNGRGTTAKAVKEMLEGAVSVQGQNEFIRLLKPEFQLEMVDRLGKLEGKRKEFGELYDLLESRSKELSSLITKREELVQKRDFYEFRLKEVDEVGLKAEEIEEIKAKAETLKHLEKVKKAIAEALAYLQDSDNSAYDSLGSALKSLWRIREFSDLDKEIEILTEIRDKTLEVSESLRDHDVELSPEEIDRINEILYKVQRLESKYKKPYPEILKEVEEIRRELASSYLYEDTIEALDKEVKELEGKVLDMARDLSRRRRETAKLLETRTEEVLRDLNLERAKLRVSFEEGKLTRTGIDRVKFLFSSYGSDMQPLEEVASGGELTRLFLALSLIQPPTGTYIFDEVDVGVSGETSIRLAKLLKKLSKEMQIIVITHSAPICAAGDKNFLTEKEYLGEMPYIRVKELSSQGKLQEVARLMGTTTENTIKGAEELVDIVNA